MPLMIGTLNKVSNISSILKDRANMTPSPMLRTPLLICIAWSERQAERDPFMTTEEGLFEHAGDVLMVQ